MLNEIALFFTTQQDTYVFSNVVMIAIILFLLISLIVSMVRNKIIKKQLTASKEKGLISRRIKV